MSDDLISAEQAQALLDGATPGPWKCCETTIHGRKYGGCWVEGPDVDDGDGRPRGVLIPISGSGGAISYTTRLVDIQDHDHNDANANLIAAAPDLARTVIAQAAEIARLRAQVEAADRLAEAVVPRIQPVQNADFARQVREHDALAAALATYQQKREGGE